MFKKTFGNLPGLLETENCPATLIVSDLVGKTALNTNKSAMGIPTSNLNQLLTTSLHGSHNFRKKVHRKTIPFVKNLRSLRRPMAYHTCFETIEIRTLTGHQTRFNLEIFFNLVTGNNVNFPRNDVNEPTRDSVVCHFHTFRPSSLLILTSHLRSG